VPIMLSGIEGIRACVGFNLGHSDWVEVDQAMLASFESLSVDCLQMQTAGSRERQVPCAVLLALVIPMLQEIYVIEDTRDFTLCGVEQLHFLLPVPANTGLRLGAAVKAVRPVDDHWQLTLACVMECDVLTIPVLRADVLYQFRTRSRTPMPQLSLCRSE